MAGSCFARPVGCGVGVIATINDPASHLSSTASLLYPITDLLSSAQGARDRASYLCLDPDFAIYARVLGAIYKHGLEPLDSHGTDHFFIHADAG